MTALAVPRVHAQLRIYANTVSVCPNRSRTREYICDFPVQGVSNISRSSSAILCVWDTGIHIIHRIHGNMF